MKTGRKAYQMMEVSIFGRFLIDAVQATDPGLLDPTEIEDPEIRAVLVKAFEALKSAREICRDAADDLADHGDDLLQEIAGLEGSE